MAIGVHPNNQVLNSTLSQLTGQLRDLCTRIAALQAYTALLGHAGLVGTGMTSGDADQYIAAMGQLSTAAAVFTGQATVLAPENFLAEITATAGLF